ncbi:MAG: thiolase family protein, partial [Myxococcota bacterium]|nr:thiolase family protein [Myxococcota bacterium]
WPLMQEEIIPTRTPIVNVEAGCATGSVAFHSALQALHQHDFSMAVGVEKLIFENDPKLLKSFPLFGDGIDKNHSEEWMSFYRSQSQKHNLSFQPHPYRVIFIDIHAMQAQHSLLKGSCTKEHIAIVASKNHNNGKKNPFAQYRFGMSVEQVLSDRAVLEPFTRSMCAPISDGAAAILLCSDSAFEKLPAESQARGVYIRASAMSSGTMRDLTDDSVTYHAARKAYQQAGLQPSDIDFAEVHDSTAHCELKHLESLGFCEKAGPYVASGETFSSGSRPINASGGLIAKGHPLGATGLGMLFELTNQLRQEAGRLQVDRDVKIGLAQNAGGMIGFDEAMSAVTILEKRA